MRTMHKLLLTLGIAAGLASAAHAEPLPAPANAPASAPIFDPTAVHHPLVGRRHFASHIRPHDVSHPVLHVARVVPHEAASLGVSRSRSNLLDSQSNAMQRVAVLDRANNACDSLLCPGYAILGVGF